MKSITLFFMLIVAACSSKNVDWSKTQETYSRRPTGRIVGGLVAEPHQFPYQVALHADIDGVTYSCGGTLIDTSWVLTAAHCVHNATTVRVSVGAHDFSKPFEVGRKDYVVDEGSLIVHKEYNKPMIIYDIALVHLPTPVELNEYVKLIRLPTLSEAQFSIEGQLGLVSGWGRFSDTNLFDSVVLKYVMVPIVPLQVCAKYYNIIRNEMVCTEGVEKKSPCAGDSGGPLVANLPKGPAVVGLVSFGAKLGCEVGWPEIYTRVASYLDWISSKTGIEIEQ